MMVNETSYLCSYLLSLPKTIGISVLKFDDIGAGRCFDIKSLRNWTRCSFNKNVVTRQTKKKSLFFYFSLSFNYQNIMALSKRVIFFKEKWAILQQGRQWRQVKPWEFLNIFLYFHQFKEKKKHNIQIRSTSEQLPSFIELLVLDFDVCGMKKSTYKRA